MGALWLLPGVAEQLEKGRIVLTPPLQHRSAEGTQRLEQGRQGRGFDSCENWAVLQRCLTSGTA